MKNMTNFKNNNLVSSLVSLQAFLYANLHIVSAVRHDICLKWQDNDQGFTAHCRNPVGGPAWWNVSLTGSVFVSPICQFTSETRHRRLRGTPLRWALSRRWTANSAPQRWTRTRWARPPPTSSTMSPTSRFSPACRKRVRISVTQALLWVTFDPCGCD